LVVGLLSKKEERKSKSKILGRKLLSVPWFINTYIQDFLAYYYNYH